MSKQIQDAYIVAATRLPVAKRKGMFGHVRPDDMLAHAIRSVLAQVPEIDPALVEDVIVGCAMPEAEQGMNVARIGAAAGRSAEHGAGLHAQPLLLLRACRRWPMPRRASGSARPT
jgi:acetyl-CoA acetyltransferase